MEGHRSAFGTGGFCLRKGFSCQTATAKINRCNDKDLRVGFNNFIV